MNSQRAGPRSSASPGELDDGLLAAPVGCNNGCCDREWLATMYECGIHGWISWFDFNALSSVRSTNNDIKHFKGMVCAANGATTWRWKVNKSYTWNVPQANFFVAYWDATCFLGICSDFPASSTTNSPGTPTLHTHCGYFMW